MIQKTVYLSIFCLSATLLVAQSVVWNRELPLENPISPSNCRVLWHEGKYLFCAQKSLIELNKEGFITNSLISPAEPPDLALGSFVSPRRDALTNERYFLMAYRSSAIPAPMYFAEFRPGTGFVLQTPFEEGYNNKSFSPAILETNDSTFMVFGKNAVRQIVHRPGDRFVQKWEKPLAMGSVQAVKASKDRLVAVSQTGKISGFDVFGNVLWTISTAYSLNNIQVASDGFLICGDKGLSRKGVVVKLDNNGAVQWQKEYDAFAFDGLTVLADGHFAVSGQTNAGTIVLANFNAVGEQIWQKTYQKGRGNFLMATSDGGYLIAGLSSIDGNRYAMLKTDALGNTGAATPVPDFRYRTLENDQLRVQVKPDAALFWDAVRSKTTLLVPKTQQAGIFGITGLYLDAFDNGQVAHISQVGYTEETTDYRPGLVNAPAADFSHTWYVNRAQIDALRQDWLDNGVLDQVVPTDILTWPARGNPDFGPNLDFSMSTTERQLLPAPFVDANGDGEYRVGDGDYPLLKGDQMGWFAITDNAAHAFSNGLPLLCDIAVCAYIFDCPGDPFLETAVFVDYEITNRSFNRYSNMYARLWSDPDLGCPFDDYVGSLPASNAYYIYNQDVMDGLAGDCAGTPLFAGNIPVGGVQFLNTSLDAFVGEDSMSVSGMLYPGNPSDINGLSLCTENKPNKDWRMLASHGPFVLEPNARIHLNVAFTYHPNVPLPCPDIYGLVQPNIDRLHLLSQSDALKGPAKLLPEVDLLAGQSALLDATVPGATAYLWSNGSTTAQVNIVQAGVYTVTITRATGCSFVEMVKVRIVTDAAETNQVGAFRIYPNPNKGQFQLELRGSAAPSISCRLINAVGQVVRTEEMDFETGALYKAMDYGGLPAGVYTLQVRVGKRSHASKVVIVTP